MKNKKLLKSLLIVFILCLIVFQPNDGSCIDPNYPQIGQQIPDFTLDSISNYSKTKVTKGDLMGQYYILEFWSSNCGACIASFPKLNVMQKKYKDRLQIFLIGFPDKTIRKLYETLRVKHQLDLSVAFDAKLTHDFVPAGVPHLIWIDKKGVIQAITTTEDLNENNIDNFLNHNKFKFNDYSYKGLKSREEKFNPSFPFLVNNNGGNDGNFIFRSILSKWQKGMAFYYPGDFESVRDNYYNPGGYTILKVKLSTLYNLAYYGRYNPSSDSTFYYPILKLKDSTNFKVNELDGSGLYSYSITVPPDKYNKEGLRLGLRKDLEYYFPYKAQIEKRMMPCYIIKISDKSKLPKLHNPIEKKYSSKYMNIVYDNVTMPRLAISIAGHLLSHNHVYDETGISYNVSLKINGLNTEPNIVKDELRKYGLDLVQATRLMNVLVISD